MRIAFRADASLQIGSGHIMRCLALADALRKLGCEISFICKQHESNLINKIHDLGYQVGQLSVNESECADKSLVHAAWLGGTQKDDVINTIGEIQSLNVDWMIVDHYAIDEYWHKKIRPHVKRILVIDDLGDRKHDCDVLLDQNLGATHEKYHGLVPNHCESLLGPKFALLRPEFAKWREKSLERRSNTTEPKNIFISLGGVDPLNITSEVINVVSDMPLLENSVLNVVVGSQCLNLDSIKVAASKSCNEVNVYVDTDQMAELMANADIAIGASGSSSWERCALGVPSIQFVVAENQKDIALNLEKSGAAIVVQHPCELESKLKIATLDLISMSKNSSIICDGFGANQVAKLLDVSQ